MPINANLPTVFLMTAKADCRKTMEVEFQKERRTILVSGAGIAGLASALFISRAGFRVEVFEQAATLDPIGSGLQLSPNAMHVLNQLGLERLIKAVAMAPEKIEVMRATDNKKIIDIPLGVKVSEEYGQPYLVIYRADLQNILYSACLDEPDITFHMGTTVHDAVTHPNGVSIVANDKSKTTNFCGVALIGADGVQSNIRKECFVAKETQLSGTCALRALVRSDLMPVALQDGNIKMWLGTKAHAVIYQVRAERYHNIILTVPENFATSPLSNKITGAKIAAELNNWCPQFLSLLDLNIEWTRWPLKVAPRLQSWAEGCIVLVGDAAHAMTPHAAQGAAMALEDAAVLGWALQMENDLAKAFILYQKTRIGRVNKARRLSSSNKVLYQLPFPLSTFRNCGMKILGGERILKKQDWVYRWQPPSSNDQATS